MNNQFIQKVVDLSSKFTLTNDCDYYEFKDGEYSWVVRKRILDNVLVEYYVSRFFNVTKHKQRAFLYPDGNEWSIETVR